MDGNKASKLFVHREEDCVRVLTRLNSLIKENREQEYTTAYGREELLGNYLTKCTYDRQDSIDLWPFKELWMNFYEQEIRDPQLLMEVFLYQCCRTEHVLYLDHLDIYKKVFGKGLLKKPPFQDLLDALRYENQVDTVLGILYRQYVPEDMKIHWGLTGLAKLLTVLNEENAFFEAKEKRWNGETEVIVKRAVTLPIFKTFLFWTDISGRNWKDGFVLRFRLQEFYDKQKKEPLKRGQLPVTYVKMSDFVKCVELGIWDKELFYKASLTWYSMGALLAPATTVQQRGMLTYREANQGVLNQFFGDQVIQPKDGKYCFDTIRDSLPAMKLAHDIYEEVLPLVLKVELKRGEQETPFSSSVSSIKMVRGIDILIQILTALGKDPLDRTYHYYGYGTNVDRRQVLSHLLSVCYPKQGETAADLAKALVKPKGEHATPRYDRA